MAKGEKTKQLWQNPEYRKLMMKNHHFIGGWNKTNILKDCLNCRKSFRRPPSAKAKFCSKVCANKGKECKGILNYSNLHRWVYRNLGKAKKCEHKDDDCNKKYEWANKSHKYKKELDDWMELCNYHHQKYDLSGFYSLRKDKIKKVCLKCNRIFYVFPYREKTAKYCSKNC